MFLRGTGKVKWSGLQYGLGEAMVKRCEVSMLGMVQQR